MKKYKTDWKKDIVTYIFKTYVKVRYTKQFCEKCPFQVGLSNTILSKKEYANREFYNKEKLCKYLCVYYY